MVAFSTFHKKEMLFLKAYYIESIFEKYSFLYLGNYRLFFEMFGICMLRCIKYIQGRLRLIRIIDFSSPWGSLNLLQVLILHGHIVVTFHCKCRVTPGS